MTASHNLPQPSASCKSSISRSGVLTIQGYGVRVRMQSGHLEIEDGIADERRKIRLPRVASGLRRLVMIGSDGFVTFDALRWLADQDASFVMLERNGRILCVTGPTSPSDARLRRAQALALHTGKALEISRQLIRVKLEGQERVAHEQLNQPATADAIARLREQLATANDLDTVRCLEGQAARAYWNAWNEVPVLFPRKDLERLPDHWLFFGTRHSPLTGQPRLAVNPPNAILNYCFALAESECRLALCACGLDPGIGFIHVDTPNRDSLALDLLETVRPSIEAWLLHLITREPLRRSDFFETGTGNCRLMSRLCSQLSETAPTWGRLVAPWAEYVARGLWTRNTERKEHRVPPTRLTQRHRRQAKGSFELPKVNAPRLQKVCRGCGVALHGEWEHCSKCGVEISRANMIEIAHRGRIASKSAASLSKQSAAQKRQRAARRAWNPSKLPAWLTRESYREMIWPALAKVTVPRIAKALNVSEGYASRLRKGLHVPHPMHWEMLAELVGLSK